MQLRSDLWEPLIAYNERCARFVRKETESRAGNRDACKLKTMRVNRLIVRDPFDGYFWRCNFRVGSAGCNAKNRSPNRSAASRSPSVVAWA